MSEYPSYLIHYGIQGQKWGVRRFQNEDGTYTSEGLERRKAALDSGASRKEIRLAAKADRSELKARKHFVAEQRRTNKRFDKITSKIQKDQEKGKEISEKRYNKAVQLGTKHRALDYISERPQPYLKAHGLNKGSGAKFGVQLGLGIATAGDGGIAIIPKAIVERKLEKKFLKEWMQRQYGEVISKCRNVTIKDLEKHGIKRNKEA